MTRGPQVLQYNMTFSSCLSSCFLNTVMWPLSGLETARRFILRAVHEDAERQDAVAALWTLDRRCSGKLHVLEFAITLHSRRLLSEILLACMAGRDPGTFLQTPCVTDQERNTGDSRCPYSISVLPGQVRQGSESRPPDPV
ncbi:hypothetical protein DENSPDRAFT_83523 [Dentipellis sp. KUC8613]|nr:hypothetical protein DENSPDRAFT_83523 [Dentipellis sp. KUC8613]